jgi:hypothetical protein
MLSLTASLAQWRDFYMLIGSASATLVALIFVAASIGAGVFTRAHQVGIRSFLSPTVVHFTAILVICLFAIIPTQTWFTMGALLVCSGAVGMAYSGWVWRRMMRHGIIGTIDAIDRLWYAQLPIAAYLLIVSAGIALWKKSMTGLDLLAATQILLLLIGIRNAWDMTVWIIDRRQSPSPPGDAGT